jgi:hypothetical protein
VSMSISNRSFACENDGPLKRNCTLESSQSVARAQWLWHFALAAANAVLKNSQGTKVVLTFVSQHNHSLFAHGTFSAHGGNRTQKVTDLRHLAQAVVLASAKNSPISQLKRSIRSCRTGLMR